MNPRRRLLVTGAAALLALGAGGLAALPAAAQGDFPSRPIRLVVPYAPGGIADLLGRLIAERLGALVKQTVVVENRPGAGGHVGGEMVAKSPPDGYTLVLATIAHNGAVAMYKGLKYDPATDLQPVVLVAESAGVLLVHPDVPARTVAEFIALVKAQPGRLNYASAGNGSAIHMATELFKHMTGTELVHVPYKGSGPAMADLLGGRVQVMFENIATGLPHVKSGKVRALAVTGRARYAGLPEVPTIAESGVPGYAAEPWYTVSAPKGLPPEVLKKLNAELHAVIRSPELAARWQALGVTPLGGSPDDALRRNAQENDRWTRVIQAARIQAD
ncbi:MAG: tripartite tricarboxylate transporter substrate binding protein [Burkholderiales bacterium]|nr:tripartite tricarboxylate transporter substrate binding protein [Burkholderiales bacterium]